MIYYSYVPVLRRTKWLIAVNLHFTQLTRFILMSLSFWLTLNAYSANQRSVYVCIPCYAWVLGHLKSLISICPKWKINDF